MDKLDMSLDDLTKTGGGDGGRGGRGSKGSGRGRGGMRSAGGREPRAGSGANGEGFDNPLSRDNDFDVPSAGNDDEPRGGPVRRGRRNQRESTPYSRPSRSEGSWTRGEAVGSGRQGSQASQGGASNTPRVITTTSSKVMVTNLDSEVTDEDLREIFEQAGELKACKLKTDTSGKSMGTAEIAFVKKGDAAKCVKDFDGAEVDGRPMYLRLLESAGPVVKRVNQPSSSNLDRGQERTIYRPGQQRGARQSRGGKESLFGSKLNSRDDDDDYGSFGGRRGGDRDRGRAAPQRGGRKGGRGGNSGGGRGGRKGGRGGRKGGKGEDKKSMSAEDLDADMDSYFNAAAKPAEAGMTDE